MDNLKDPNKQKHSHAVSNEEKMRQKYAEMALALFIICPPDVNVNPELKINKAP